MRLEVRASNPIADCVRVYTEPSRSLLDRDHLAPRLRPITIDGTVARGAHGGTGAAKGGEGNFADFHVRPLPETGTLLL